MLVMRSARSDDHGAFVELARSAGPGFTSLAVDDDALSARLITSQKSFAGQIEERSNASYQLMLEDSETGKVLGTSAVKAEIGKKKPYFDFKIITISQSSNAAGKRFDMDALLLANDFAGASEVGSLFVLDGLRGTGAGRLCSQSRYLLIAADPSRFGDRVLAELRGVVSKTDGHSPFYEAVAKPFFRMDFTQADELSASSDNQFILDLMPTNLIYVELLPDDAKAVIGKTHPEGENALRLLEREGFRYDRYVDIFDGGPLVSARTDKIKTIKESDHYQVTNNSLGEGRVLAMVSTDRMDDFRCVYTHVGVGDGAVSLDDETRRALNVSEGETVRAWFREPVK
jgi:arginine N-succinyltransferase